jgi:hypothetical protein
MLPKKRKSPVPVQLLNQVRARERQEMEDRKLARENAERRSLLEDIIDRGFQTFLEVGSALKEIKERKLWSPEYASFEDYCEGRWNWTMRYANNVVRAARTAQILGPPFPANEAIAREMAKLVEQDPEQGQAAWAAFIAESPNPTAKETRAFLRNYLREEPAARPTPPKPLAVDATKRTIQYLESNLAELEPRQRASYLAALYRHVQEAMYLSFGASRIKAKRKINSPDNPLSLSEYLKS